MEIYVVDVFVNCPSLRCSGTAILLLAKVTTKQQPLPEPGFFVSVLAVLNVRKLNYIKIKTNH